MKICIIDSGVCMSIKELYCNINFYNYKVNNNNEIVVDENSWDEIGHGTAINNIICKHSLDLDVKMEIYNIKIFESELKIDTDKLISALKFCCGQKFAVINLSMGCYADDNELEKICNQLCESGSIICAASNLSCYNTFPAKFSSTICVSSTEDSRLLKTNEHVYIDDENNNYNILAYGGKKRVAWLNNKNIIAEGVSFACPVIVNKIIDAISAGYNSIDSIKLHLKNTSKIQIGYEKNYNEIKLDENVALFPFNKEMHSVVIFNQRLNITKVYDFRGRGIVGKNTRHFIEDLDVATGLIIDNVEDESSYDDFETIIIGDCSKLYEVYGSRLEACMQKWIYSGKKIYTFMSTEGMYKNCISLLPCFDIEYYKKLVNMDIWECVECLIPVLGIYGTGTQQGKFTIQNKIAKNLEFKGYRTSLLCTENQSVLLNCDMVFPYGGFNNKLIQLPPYLTNKIYLYFLKQLSFRKADLIIVSGQSGIIDCSIRTNMSLIQNIDLLLLSKIDVSILVFNSNDSFNKINRGVKVLQAFTNKRIACIVMFPYHKGESRTTSELKEMCAHYENVFKINCHFISDTDSICRDIIEAFKDGY